MKKTRYSESQIIKVLKEVEAGRSAKDVCRVKFRTTMTLSAFLRH